jgi:hypothetical protein
MSNSYVPRTHNPQAMRCKCATGNGSAKERIEVMRQIPNAAARRQGSPFPQLEIDDSDGDGKLITFFFFVNSSVWGPKTLHVLLLLLTRQSWAVWGALVASTMVAHKLKSEAHREGTHPKRCLLIEVCASCACATYSADLQRAAVKRGSRSLAMSCCPFSDTFPHVCGAAIF